VLDGVPREIVRTRDSIRCYLRRAAWSRWTAATAERDSALCPSALNELARHYDHQLGERPRIAGFDCRRWCSRRRTICAYGYKLPTPTRAAGMLLRAGPAPIRAADTVEQSCSRSYMARVTATW